MPSLWIVFLLFAAPLAAQSGGELTGSVRDAAGALVPGARLVLTEAATGAALESATNDAGVYRFQGLRPGAYTVTIRRDGFRETSIVGVAVESGRIVRADATLEVAAAAEQITVSAAAQLLDFESGTQGTMLTVDELKKLPLQFRNATAFLVLSPGVQTTGGNFALNRLSAGGDNTSSRFTINGGARYNRGGFNELIVDGISFTSPEDGNMATLPGSESIADVRVQSGSMSSEFGNTAGGVINMSTRGGTNEIHGTLNYFHRSTATIARLALPATAAKPPNIVNVGAAGVGGPLVRNRTFAFFSYEYASWLRKEARTSTIPTPAMRLGDFSALSGVIFDPATSAAVGSRQPFAGNVIPSSRFNPFGRRILDLYPSPVIPGLASNYQGTRTIHQFNHNYLGRLDHSVSDRQRLMFKTGWVDPGARNVWELGDVDQDSSISRIPSRSFVANYTNVFSPALVYHMAAGYVRMSRSNDDPSGNTDGPSFFGHTVTPAENNRAANTRPGARFDIYRGVGFSSGQYTVNDFFQLTPSLTWNKGLHTLRLGADLRRRRVSGLLVFGSPNGNFTFNAVQTSNGSAANGNSAASALLGLASAASFQRNPFLSVSNNTGGVYVQDDWKIRPNLTLNLGLRWDGEGPYSERWGRVGYFDPDATNPVVGVPGVYRYAGLSGARKTMTDGDYNNLAPRIGLAWTPGRQRRLVIRGGFSAIYAPYSNRGFYSAGPGFETTLVNVAPAAGQPALVLRNSYVFPEPTGPEGDAAYLGRAVTESYGRHVQRPVVYQWNLGFQRELAHNTVAEIAWSGNRGTRLADSFNLNLPPLALVEQAVAAQAASGRAGTALDFLNRPVPNPLAGRVPGAFGAATTPISRALQPFPQFVSVNAVLNNRDSIYHSMQAAVQRRLSGDLTFMAAYTWSKALDNVTEQDFGQDNNTGVEQNVYNLRQERGPALYDRLHKLTGNIVARLPFGSGRPLLNQGVAAALAGGWRLNSLWNFESGQPIGARQTTGTGLPGGARPDVLDGHVAAATRVRRTVAANGNVNWFDPRSYVPVNGRWGSAPLRDSRLRGPGFWSVDFGLQREFRFTERWLATFRAEAFNAFNRTNLRNPEQNINSPQFGQISQVHDPRQFQFGLEVRF